MSQKTIVAVATTSALVAGSGRLVGCHGHDERQAVAGGCGVGADHSRHHAEVIVSTSNSIRVELGEGRRHSSILPDVLV